MSNYTEDWEYDLEEADRLSSQDLNSILKQLNVKESEEDYESFN